MKRFLFISPYNAQSHERWWRSLQSHFPEIDWVHLILPARNFSWRFRGNALSLSQQFHLELQGKYDAILATSMTDIATLRSFYPNLCEIKTILYFHENQFVYPLNQTHSQDQLHFCLQSIFSAKVSDVLVFNSQYNRDSFLEGMASLFKKLPDFVPLHWQEEFQQKAIVLPVPVEVKENLLSESSFSSRSENVVPLFVWNHRWEYDKGPTLFFEAFLELKKRKLSFQLCILGQQFRKTPAIFERARKELKEEIVCYGFCESKTEYFSWLQKADFVVSTTFHEFQGLSVLEAFLSGCEVIAPDRLVFPEWFDADCLYPSFPKDEKQELAALVQHIEKRLEKPSHSHAKRDFLRKKLSWKTLQLPYQQLLIEEHHKFEQIGHSATL